MKLIDHIIADAISVSAVLGQEISLVDEPANPRGLNLAADVPPPAEIPGWPTSPDSLFETVYERLVVVSNMVDDIRADVHRQVSESGSQYQLKSVGFHISEASRAVKYKAPIPLIGILGLLWSSFEGDLVFRRQNFAMALLAGAFLEDRALWRLHYSGPDPRLAEVMETRRHGIRSLFAFGQINPVLDFGFLDDRFFVEAAFIHILGRSPDASGLMAFQDALAKGRARAEVYNEIAQSAEAKARGEIGLLVGFNPTQSVTNAPHVRLFGSLVASLACIETL